MTSHWLVSFEAMDCLHHGIRNKLWMMGYQYARKGNDNGIYDGTAICCQRKIKTSQDHIGFGLMNKGTMFQ